MADRSFDAEGWTNRLSHCVELELLTWFVRMSLDQIRGLALDCAPWHAVLRDVLGNPFRRATADPAWLTSTVIRLASGIYADRAFNRLPILADALQDAGCEDEQILGHCRGPGPHVRGCWVVDLLLGRG